MADDSVPDRTDARLYVRDARTWQAHVKVDGEKHYCFAKMPGEDFFHRISQGEIYIGHEHEMYCLDCAIRLDLVTDDRMFWQRRSS